MMARNHAEHGLVWSAGPKAGIALVTAAVLAMACATGSGSTGEEPAFETAPVLQNIVVEQRDGLSVVSLPGTLGAYASSSQDGSTIVLDLEGVEMPEAVAPIAVYDGLVEQVSTVWHEDTGAARIEVTLSKSASHELVPAGEGYELRIGSDDADAWASDDGYAADLAADFAESDDWQEMPESEGAEAIEAEVDAELADASDAFDYGYDEGEDAGDVSGVDTLDGELAAFGDDAFGATGGGSLSVEIPDPPAARTLTAVEVETTEGGDLLHLGADGVIGAAEAFVLDGPPRLVIDLPGMANTVHPANVSMARAGCRSCASARTTRRCGW